MHLANLHDGAIPVPPRTKSVLIEIGCSDRDTMDEQELPRLNDTFLIAFEPLIDKWAALLARGGPRFNGRGVSDRAVPLGHHHPRGVVLPFAVSAPSSSTSGGSRGSGGMAMFNVSRIAGCSSLLGFNENTTWGQQCFRGAGKTVGAAGILESRLVPTISMQAALSLAPRHLPIEKLKVDAQGLDLELLKSGGAEAMQRVQSLELEVVKHGCPTLYVGQDYHTHAMSYLRSLGFALTGWRWHGHLKCEGTGFFARPGNTVRPGVPGATHGMRDAPAAPIAVEEMKRGGHDGAGRSAASHKMATWPDS